LKQLRTSGYTIFFWNKSLLVKNDGNSKTVEVHASIRKQTNNAGECHHNSWWLTEFAKKPTDVLWYKKRISLSQTL
jgi:hypothetical protein